MHMFYLHICLVFKVIFTVLADCQFDGSTCTPLNQDLGQFEITVRFGW